jgi:hypothetical protein
MAEGAVSSELVSAGDSLFIRENTGKLACFVPELMFQAALTIGFQGRIQEIP